MLEALRKLSKKAGLHPQHDRLVELCEAIGSDARFAHLDPTALFNTAKRILGNKPKDTHTAVTMMHDMLIGGGKTDIHLAKILNSGEAPQAAEEAIVKELYSAEVKPSYSPSYSSTHTPSRPTSTIERMTAQWEGLATEHKVSVGLSCLLAGLMAISSVTQFAHAVDTDAEGKRHVHASNIIMGGVSALLTAGMLYLTHAQVRGVTR